LVKLTISVEESETNGYLRRAARALSRRYRMPGFRPGKAPYNVVVRRLGIDSVQAQALEQFGDEVYQKGLEESEIEPADQASLDNVTWDPFTLHLTVPVAPQVELGDYLDVRLPWEEPEVTPQALEEALQEMQKEQREWTPEERPAQYGDQVLVDIKGTVDDEVVLENVGREMVLEPESRYPLPDFGSALVGMSPGEEREFELPYPQDHYNADIAGKVGHFKVNLHEIRGESLPELDDEFAMLVGDYDSLEDLKAQVTESLKQEAIAEAEREYEEQMWERFFETVTIEYPEVSLEREIESIKRQLQSQLSQNNIELDTFFQMSGTTEEAWQEEVRPQAEQRLKRNLVLGEVIRDQNLQIDQEEIQAEIETIVEPMGENSEEMRNFFNSPTGQIGIIDSVIMRKALDTLKEIARGEYQPQAEEEAEGQGEEPAADASEATEAKETAESPAEEESVLEGPSAEEKVETAPEGTEASPPENVEETSTEPADDTVEESSAIATEEQEG
jgi:trigger factor